MKRPIYLSLFALLTLSCGAQTFSGIRYAQRDTLSLLLDIYQPDHPRADKACVIYVFGGGFFSGQRNDQSSVQACQLLADRGFTAVAIDYRLYMSHAPQVSIIKAYTIFDTAIRQAVEDLSSAIGFLCSHASEYGIDTSRVILTGSSAGAIAVLQTDYARCNSLPMAAEVPTSFRPVAVVPYSGAIFCRNRALKYAQPPAPTCFFHGTEDRIVNYNRFRGAIHSSLFGANQVSKVFRKHQYSYWIFRYEGIGHEVAGALSKTIDEFCAFVNATLAGRQMQYDATCHSSNIQPTKWSKMNLFDLYNL